MRVRPYAKQAFCTRTQARTWPCYSFIVLTMATYTWSIDRPFFCVSFQQKIAMIILYRIICYQPYSLFTALIDELWCAVWWICNLTFPPRKNLQYRAFIEEQNNNQSPWRENTRSMLAIGNTFFGWMHCIALESARVPKKTTKKAAEHHYSTHSTHSETHDSTAATALYIRRRDKQEFGMLFVV